MPRGIYKRKTKPIVEPIGEIVVSTPFSEAPEPIIDEPTTLGEAFAKYGFEYRPECHRLIDLAKKLGVYYKFTDELQDVLSRIQ